MKKTTDALDQPRGKQRWSKKQRAEYARKMHEEALIIPPKNGIAPFLLDASLLPKLPPSRFAKPGIIDKEE